MMNISNPHSVNRRGKSAVTTIRLTTVVLSLVLVLALFGRTGKAIDLMKLIEQAQRHRALKRASQSILILFKMYMHHNSFSIVRI